MVVVVFVVFFCLFVCLLVCSRSHTAQTKIANTPNLNVCNANTALSPLDNVHGGCAEYSLQKASYLGFLLAVCLCH